jgi:hypothetical protein
MCLRTIVVAVLALAVVPSGAAAATWSAPQALTRSGDAFDPAVAINFDGRSLVAWRRFFEGNHRVRATSVRRDGHVGPVRQLSGGGESAYEPAFLPSADGQTYLRWPRRTFGQFAPFANGAFQPLTSSPGAAIGASPAAAVDSTGAIVLVWTAGGQVLTATGRPGAAFSAPTVLAAAGSDPQATVLPDGTAVAAWTTSAGIVAAARPAGGSFGAPVTIVDGTASGAQIIASAASEVMVASVDASRQLRLQRLTPALARIGAPFDLGAGDQTLGVALARDGSAVFASWTARVTGAIHVRRLAPGGIFGVARTIATRSLLRGHPPATAAGAVAWVNGGGTLLMSRYR